MQPQSIAFVEAGFSGTLLALHLLRHGPPAAHPRLIEQSPDLQPHVFEIDGAFVGAAVRLDTGYHFVATDFRLDELDGTTWPSLADLQRVAHRLFRTGNIAAPQATAEPTPRAAH